MKRRNWAGINPHPGVRYYLRKGERSTPDYPVQNILVLWCSWEVSRQVSTKNNVEYVRRYRCRIIRCFLSLLSSAFASQTHLVIFLAEYNNVWVSKKIRHVCSYGKTRVISHPFQLFTHDKEREREVRTAAQLIVNQSADRFFSVRAAR